MNRFTTITRCAAWAAAVLVLVLGLAWVLRNLRPTPAGVSAQETAPPSEPAPIENTPTAAPTGPEMTVYVTPGSLVPDPTGRWLAYTSSEGRVWVRDVAGNEIEIAGLPAAYPAELRVSWSPDGDELAIYGLWGLEYPRTTGLWVVPMDADGPGEALAVIAPVTVRSTRYHNDGAVASAAWLAGRPHLAYVYYGNAWAVIPEAAGNVENHRMLTDLALNPLPRTQGSESFDEVVSATGSPDGVYLALELACNCASPWSGVGVVNVESGEVRLLVDGGRPVGWSPDRKIVLQNVTGDYAIGYTYDFYTVDPADGTLTNLTRSNPDLDPLVDGWDNYVPAAYETFRLAWGPDGQYIVSTRHFLGEDASTLPPALGFAVYGAPGTLIEEHFGSQEAWYVFPAWLPDGKVGYLEAEPVFPNVQYENLYRVRRVVVDGEPAAGLPENLYVSEAAWSPDGKTLTLVTSEDPGQLANVVRTIRLGE